jgi:hypothetical protein
MLLGKLKTYNKSMMSSTSSIWKTHNDLICFQVDLERMSRDYAKMEEFSLEQ